MMVKWPPDPNHLEKSVGFQDMEKCVTRYMKMNNFKLEEIYYIYYMMNTFCYLNNPRMNGQE
jgi:hypothetical protein